jgi:hypothetical protein
MTKGEPKVRSQIHINAIKRARRLAKAKLIIRDDWSSKIEVVNPLTKRVSVSYQYCLLGAMHKESAINRHHNYCPTEIMPKFMAAITPIIDDYVSLEKWEDMVSRYIGLASKWYKLNSDQWSEIERYAAIAAIWDYGDKTNVYEHTVNAPKYNDNLIEVLEGLRNDINFPALMIMRRDQEYAYNVHDKTLVGALYAKVAGACRKLREGNIDPLVNDLFDFIESKLAEV